jgi:N-acylglucosamine 2-epimerase
MAKPFDLNELKDRYRRNLFDSVIPFWERHSLDREFGGQFTCLNREGFVFDTRKYVWMNGRAVWMFSRLYNTWEQRPEWLEKGRLILEFLLRHAFDEQGRCYFSLTRTGEPVFFQRKPYSAFFLVLALTEYYKTGAGTGEHLEQARTLASRVLRWISDASPLGRPRLAGQAPVRQLADIMVTASMAMELMPVSPDPLYARLLQQCLQEVRQHWLPARRTLLENLLLDGSDYRQSPDTRLLCPGSAIEVAWFLLHALEALGERNADAEKFLLDVIEGSLETGWDAEHGGLYYFLDADGRPPLQLEAHMKLWWPHTEALYALVLAYSLSGEEKWLHWLRRVDEYTFRTFVDTEHGEWFGYADRYGRVTHEMKGGPYKGFFHVPRCLLFCLMRLAG